MTLTSKIKSLLSAKGLTLSDLARYRSVTRQTLQTKCNKDSWNVSDLLAVAELTGTKLAFIDDKNDLTFVLAKPNKDK